MMDPSGLYEICEHGKRYCGECGTTIQRETYKPEQWSYAYNRILAGIERAKKREKQ